MTDQQPTENRGLVAFVESAHDQNAHCRACGEWNALVSDESSVWVECPRHARHRRDTAARVLATLVGHDRILVYRAD